MSETRQTVLAYIDLMIERRMAEIIGLVRRELAAMPLPREGPPGRDGRDGSAGAVGARGERGEPGPAGPGGARGEDGQDGLSIRHASVVDGALVLELSDGALLGAGSVAGPRGERGADGPVGPVGPAGSAGPAGEPGKHGPRGEQGAPGDVGERGPRGERGERGEAGKDGRDGINGKDGKDGRDGIASRDEIRSEIRAAIADALPSSVEREVAAEFSRRPDLRYLGVWVEGAEYLEGNMVTYAGSTWHCHETGTKDKPGTSEAWQLMVKSARRS